MIKYNDDKNITKFKLSKSSSIDLYLDKVNERFIDAIDEFVMNGSGYKVSFLGICCNMNAYKPLRGSSYDELPSYMENK